MLNAFPWPAVVLDHGGVITTVNHGWSELCAYNGQVVDDSLPGASYLAVCTGAADEVSTGVRDVIAGRRREFTCEYSCHSPSEERWFRLVATRLDGGALVVHEDITAEYSRISRWLSGTSVAVVELEADLQPGYVNPAWQRAMDGAEWTAPMAREDAAALDVRLRQCLRDGQGFTTDLRVASCWYRFVAHPDAGPSGAVRRVVLVGVDVTSARHAVALAAAERERSRLAIELHDTVVQRLYATGLALQHSRTEQGIGPAAVDDALERLERSITDLRSLGRSVAGTPGSVDAAVDQVLADAAGALGFAPSVRVSADLADLDPSTGHHLLAVLSEALSNVARHAGATSCEVDLVVRSGALVLTVTDDGCGMPETLRRASGTTNIGRRAGELGGRAVWTDAPFGGTVVTWQVPAARSTVASQAAGA